MRPAILLVVLVVLLPSTAACTLAGDPQQPARFAVWNPGTDERHFIDLTGRQLGADCRLANGFAYDGRHFAWLAGDGNLPPTLRLRDLHTGQEWSEQLAGSYSMDITLAGNRLFIVWLPDATQEWKAASMNLQLGDRQEIGLPSWAKEGRGEWHANDGILAWVRRIHDGEDFGIYDPVARQVRVDASQGSVLGWGGRWPGAYVDPQHFGSVQALGWDEDGLFVLDYVTRSRIEVEPRTADRNPTPLGVSGHEVLWGVFDGRAPGVKQVWMQNVAVDAEATPVPSGDSGDIMHFLGLHGDTVVLGAYSAEGLPEAWGGPSKDTVDAPAGSAALLLVAIGLAARRGVAERSAVAANPSMK